MRACEVGEVGDTALCHGKDGGRMDVVLSEHAIYKGLSLLQDISLPLLVIFQLYRETERSENSDVGLGGCMARNAALHKDL